MLMGFYHLAVVGPTHLSTYIAEPYKFLKHLLLENADCALLPFNLHLRESQSLHVKKLSLLSVLDR